MCLGDGKCYVSVRRQGNHTIKVCMPVEQLSHHKLESQYLSTITTSLSQWRTVTHWLRSWHKHYVTLASPPPAPACLWQPPKHDHTLTSSSLLFDLSFSVGIDVVVCWRVCGGQADPGPSEQRRRPHVTSAPSAPDSAWTVILLPPPEVSTHRPCHHTISFGYHC